MTEEDRLPPRHEERLRLRREDGLDAVEQERLRVEWFDLDHRQPDPDPLAPTDVSDAYEDGYVAGVAHGIAHERKRDQLAAVALAGAIAALLLIAFVVGRASAAPRSGQTTERFDMSPPSSAALSGAPQAVVNETVLPVESTSGGVVSKPLGGAPPSPAGELGSAIESGLIAYAAPSHGDRYLALPGGPGLRVRICAGGRCLERTSTDAGPALSMQRAGRIADVSFVDFAWLCRCDPPDVGLLEASIDYATGPALTAPPTDVTP